MRVGKHGRGLVECRLLMLLPEGTVHVAVCLPVVGLGQERDFYSDFFSATAQKCQMKAAVLELVRTIGAPNVETPQYIDN